MSDARVNADGLASLTVYVEDLAASRLFYEELLGLDVVQEGDWGIVLRVGDAVTFMLHPREGQPEQHLELTFDVADADGAIDVLRRRGVPVVDEPSDRAWGERDGAVADPDGNVVYLRTAVGSEPRTAQPP